MKGKSDPELLDHYGLASGAVLTNLACCYCAGRQTARRSEVRRWCKAIKYDKRGTKVAKWRWDDNRLSPMELVDAV